MKLLTTILILLTLSSCSHQTKKEDSALSQQNIKIGDSLIAHRYSNIYFSGQPEMGDLKELKKQGFVHIINLRQASEYDEALEKKTAKSQNLQYSHIPFSPQSPLTNTFIEKVTAAVMKHRKDGKTLIHCSSGNRVALWIGGHFYKDHKYNKEDSVKIAKEMGMASSKMLEALNKYLAEQK